jgi:hypothetical protein
MNRSPEEAFCRHARIARRILARLIAIGIGFTVYHASAPQAPKTTMPSVGLAQMPDHRGKWELIS